MRPRKSIPKRNPPDSGRNWKDRAEFSDPDVGKSEDEHKGEDQDDALLRDSKRNTQRYIQQHDQKQHKQQKQQQHSPTAGAGASEVDRQKAIPDRRGSVRSGTQSQDRTHSPAHHETVDEILHGKREQSKHKHNSTLTDVFSFVFFCQLFITILCVIGTNYIQANFFGEGVISIRSGNRDSSEHETVTNKVQDAINAKLPGALDTEVPKRVKTEVNSVKNDFNELIRTKIRAVEQQSETFVLGHFQNYVDPKVQAAVTKTEGFEANVHGNVDAIETIRREVTDMEKKLKDVILFQENHIGLGDKITILLGRSATIQSKLKGLETRHLQTVSAAKHVDQKGDNLERVISEEKVRREAEVGRLALKMDDILALPAELEELSNIYKDKLEQLDSINSSLTEIQRNTFNKEKFILAFIILVAIVAVLAVAVFRLYQQGGHGAVTQKNGNMRQFLKERAPEPAVCIISFDEARQSVHQRLLDSTKLPNCKVYTRVIRRHEHIKTLPRCKVYLMCTEFTERHVIIEEEGLGLGDLHRKTYDAVRDLGGSLIILYTKDPGSRQLKDNRLYNTNIHCVTSQPELMVLNNDGRFFSLYDNLTQYQKTQLRLKIGENL